MTKKHFIAIADALRGEQLSESAINALCKFMQAQNPQFKRDRWIAYLHGECGPNGGKVKVGK